MMATEVRQRKPIRRHKSSPKDDSAATPTAATKQQKTGCRMQHIFGFQWRDFSSWQAFVTLMNRPMDPACLGVTRFMFGLLMSVDIPQERGLSHADLRWGNENMCRFPLFNFLEPLPLNLMYLTYLLMLTGAVGIMLGLFFRISCVLFIIPYWYVFFLDKIAWNNHSYLYGLISVILLFTDANRYWSLDGLIWPKIRNTHVPLWNYCLLRSQVFLVYFIAGLKKLNWDWMTGYSMQDLSSHWVFSPFKFVMTEEQIDLFVVHIGGLFIDITVGFLLFFDKTRPVALIYGSSFHLMNSQIFSIGMFPYTMLATFPLFCYPDWPRRVVRFLHCDSWFCAPPVTPATASDHCLYGAGKAQDKDGKGDAHVKKKKVVVRSQASCYHRFGTLLTVVYLSWQCFMPYSHGFTKGYNNWTQGLYGYSWDMMVHSWSTQHIKISYYDRDTGNTGYLNPKAWIEGSNRWSSHADMVKQYASCIQKRLESYGLKNIELRFDIWRSINGRFQQRMFDPRVDILTADWHPLRATSWHMPLLEGLSDWRNKLKQMETQLMKSSNHSDIVFVADFPGLYLENYVHEDLGNTSLQVLSGEVMVQLVDAGQNISLSTGKSLQIPAGQYHNVHTVSNGPSCYMYIFVNTTEEMLVENVTQYEQSKTEKTGADGGDGAHQDSDNMRRYKQLLEERDMVMQQMNTTLWQRVQDFWTEKYYTFERAIKMTSLAVVSVVTKQDYKAVLDKWNISHSLSDDNNKPGGIH